MKKLIVSDAQTIVLGLQDEIRKSQESRYDHRLHGILLVAQGMTCPEVGRLLGDSPRTIENWVHRFEERGLSGLIDAERQGRPKFLEPNQLRKINAALRKTPANVGLTGNLWDGKTLSAFIKQNYGIRLGVRQCQRMFRQFGFRLRKPRPVIAHADPKIQLEYKKNCEG